MKDLIEFIARSLVDEPDSVRVAEAERGGTTRLQLEVAPPDLGKVIGRHRATGFRPRCVPDLEAMGYNLPRNLFQPD